MKKVRRGKLDKISDEEFIKIIAASTSCADAMRRLGYRCTTGAGYLLVRSKIEVMGLDISHWNKYQTKKTELPLDEVFNKNAPRGNHILKRKIIRFDMLPYRCAVCNNDGTWEGNKLVLQLDHINGDNTDNRLENLRFLCPNCHSQTKTFAGRNTGK